MNWSTPQPLTFHKDLMKPHMPAIEQAFRHSNAAKLETLNLRGSQYYSSNRDVTHVRRGPAPVYRPACSSAQALLGPCARLGGPSTMVRLPLVLVLRLAVQALVWWLRLQGRLVTALRIVLI